MIESLGFASLSYFFYLNYNIYANIYSLFLVLQLGPRFCVLLYQCQAYGVCFHEVGASFGLNGGAQLPDCEHEISLLVSSNLHLNGLAFELDIDLVCLTFLSHSIESEEDSTSWHCYFTLQPSWSHEYLVKGV